MVRPIPVVLRGVSVLPRITIMMAIFSAIFMASARAGVWIGPPCLTVLPDQQVVWSTQVYTDTVVLVGCDGDKMKMEMVPETLPPGICAIDFMEGLWVDLEDGMVEFPPMTATVQDGEYILLR